MKQVSIWTKRHEDEKQSCRAYAANAVRHVRSHTSGLLDTVELWDPSADDNEQQRRPAAATASSVKTNGSLGHPGHFIASDTSHHTKSRLYSQSWLTFSQPLPAVGNVMPSLD